MPQSAPDARPLVVFLHIPKTGGTTLWAALRRQYGRGHIRRVQKRVLAENVADLARILADDAPVGVLGMVGGHVPYGTHQHTARPVTYFTMLRDPVQWVISSYYKVLRKPDHPLHAEFVARGSVDSCMPLIEDNLQTRMIAGLDDSGECGPQHLEIARRRLHDDLRVVGLLERYDETLLLLKLAFGWRMPYYYVKNIGGNTRPSRQHSDATLDAIRAHVALDLQLYAEAQALFTQQIESHGLHFERELRRFHALNPLAARWLKMRRRLRGKPVNPIKNAPAANTSTLKPREDS